jgi:hypothetical protein
MQEASQTEMLDGLFHIPHKGAKAEFGRFLVEGVKGGEYGFYLLVAHDAKHGGTECRPGMTAIVGLALNGSPTLHFFPAGEATYVQSIQQYHELVSMCLIVGDKERLHILYI